MVPAYTYYKVTSTFTSFGFIFFGLLSFCFGLKKSKMLPPIPGGPPFLTPYSPYSSQSCLFSGSVRVSQASLSRLKRVGSPPRSGCSLRAFFLYAFLICQVVASLGTYKISQNSVVLTYSFFSGSSVCPCIPGMPPGIPPKNMIQQKLMKEVILQQMKTRGGLRAKKTCNDHSKSLPTNILTNATDSIKLQQKKNPVWTLEKLATNYVPNEIIGRDKEKAVIAEFVQNCVMNRINSKVLYISGIPGIGKTASTMEIVRQQEKQFGRNFRVSFINALTLKKQEDIYKLIWSFLTKEAENQTNIAVKHLCSRIEQKIAKIKTNHLIVIDEVDFLVTKDQKIFYNLFEWASSVTSKLSLILIANTMDFPQKLSGKVTSRMGNNRLVFTPYTYQQIQQIINQRLIGCKYFAANALVYVSKKLSSFNGDMRTVLEVLRQAVITHEENGKLGKISIESVQKIWDLKTTDKENNPPQRTIRDEIIDLLKKRNGESTSLELQQILGQHGITTTGLLTLLKQMQEQGILILKKAMKGLFQCYRVKLVDCLDP